MNTHELFDPKHRRGVWIIFAVCVLISIAATVTASLTQRDFGRIDVSNVTYPNNEWGPTIRAKLLKPRGVSEASPAPGVVYIHGYQNNRETSDAYCIEMARRGFVVLEIDALGRGNSGNPVVNGRGELVGCLFDGNYEAMTSDFVFMDDLTRSISVDIRYVLFIADKVDNAESLLRELGLE